VHSTFVQAPPGKPGESRGARLGQLVRSRSASYLDAFLLIQAMASANEPYEVWFPAQSWVHALGLNSTTGASEQKVLAADRSQWSKIIRRLVDLQLIARHKTSNKMHYVLLDESGNGSPYVRSTKAEQGTWFMIPHAYWTDGHYMNMSLAAKAMLLVALSSKKDFELPFERTQDWYGLSASTARRGFKELEGLGILTWDVSWRPEPKSKTGWNEVRTYELQGVWSLASRKLIISQRPPTADALPVIFQESEVPEGEALPAVVSAIDGSDVSGKGSTQDFEGFFAEMEKQKRKEKKAGAKTPIFS